MRNMKGSELKKRRERLGFTQEGLASQLGVSRNTVARWERDEIGIPPYLDLALKTLEREKTAKRKTL